jgi:hypothetical protein
MPEPGVTGRGLTLQTARLMWVAFLCSQGVFIAIAHTILKQRTHAGPSPAFIYAIVGLAVVELIYFFSFRGKLLARSRAKAEHGEASAAQATWTLAQVFGFAAAESIVLFGLLLRDLGVQPAWISAAFFAVGVLNLLAYYPQGIETR